MLIIAWVLIIIEIISLAVIRIVAGNTNHYSYKLIMNFRTVLSMFISINGFITGWFLCKLIMYHTLDVAIVFIAAAVIEYLNIITSKWLLGLTRINRNRRVYTREYINDAIKKFNETKDMSDINFVGEIQHPEDMED